MEDVVFLFERFGIGTGAQFFRELISNPPLKSGALYILKSLLYISNQRIIPEAVDVLLEEIQKFCQTILDQTESLTCFCSESSIVQIRSELRHLVFENFGPKEISQWFCAIAFILVDPFDQGQEILTVLLKDQSLPDLQPCVKCRAEKVYFGFLTLLESVLQKILRLGGSAEWTEFLTNQIAAFDWFEVDITVVLMMLSQWRENLSLPDAFVLLLSRNLTQWCFNTHTDHQSCLLRLLEAIFNRLRREEDPSSWCTLLVSILSSQEFHTLTRTNKFLEALVEFRKKNIETSKAVREIFMRCLSQVMDLNTREQSLQDSFVLYLVLVGPCSLPESCKQRILGSNPEYLQIQFSFYRIVDPDGYRQFSEVCLDWIRAPDSSLEQEIAGHIFLALMVQSAGFMQSLLPQILSALPPAGPQRVVHLIAHLIQEILRKPSDGFVLSLLESIDPFLSESEKTQRVWLVCLLAPLSQKSPYFGFTVIKKFIPWIEDDPKLYWKLVLWNLKQMDFKWVLTLNQTQNCFISEVLTSTVRPLISASNLTISLQFLQELGDLLITNYFFSEDFNYPQTGDIGLKLRQMPFQSLARPLEETFGILHGNLAEKKMEKALLIPQLLRCLMVLNLSDQSFFLTYFLWTIHHSEAEKDFLCIRLNCLEVFLEHSSLNPVFLEKLKACLRDQEDMSLTAGKVFGFLLVQHRRLRAEENQIEIQDSPHCFLSFQALVKIQKNLLQSNFPVLDAVLELEWMVEETIKKKQVPHWLVLESFGYLVELNKFILESTGFGKMNLAARKTFQRVVSAVIKILPAEKHPIFFQRTVKVFAQSEMDCLRAGLPPGIHLNRALRFFPTSAYLILTVRRIQKGLETEENLDSYVQQYFLQSLQLIDLVDENCSFQLHLELENLQNPFSYLLKNFLQQLLMSYNFLLKFRFRQLPENCLIQYLYQMMDLWMKLAEEHLLIKNTFLITSQHDKLIRTIKWPGYLQDLIEKSNVSKESACLHLSASEWILLAAKQLPRVLLYLSDQTGEQKDPPIVAFLLTGILALHELFLENPTWTNKMISSVVDCCANLAFFCQTVSKKTLKGFQEDWMNGSIFLKNLVRLCSAKIEILLDQLQAQTNRDLYQIRRPIEALLQEKQPASNNFLNNLQGRLQESWDLRWKVDVREISPPVVQQSVSKPIAYRMEGRHRLHQRKEDFANEEWFEEDNLTPSEASNEQYLVQQQNKRQRSNSGRIQNPFLAACLDECGEDSPGVSSEDLSALEDFIVPSRGRDYNQAFSKHYQNRKSTSTD